MLTGYRIEPGLRQITDRLWDVLTDVVRRQRRRGETTCSGPCICSHAYLRADRGIGRAVCIFKGVPVHLKIGLFLVVTLLAGCGHGLRAPEFRRSQGLAEGHQGASWEAVLPGPAFAAVAPGPEFARRDARLSARSYDAVDAMDAWPRRETPELWRWRTLHLPRDANAVIYFESSRRERSPDVGGWGGGASTYDRYRHDRNR